MKKVLLMLAIVVTFTGCMQNKTEEASTTINALGGLRGNVESPAPVLGNGNTFSGDVTIGDVPTLKKDIESEVVATTLSSYSMTTKISFAVACFFFAMSLGLGAVGIWLLIKVLSQSKAISATTRLIDTGVASAVNLASSSTDSGAIANAHSLRATLEGLRKHI